MFGLNKINNGKSSNLPAIISKDNTNLEKYEKDANEPYGPTKLNPGPILLIQESDAVRFVTKSKLSNDMINAHTTNTIIYTTKKL